MMSFKTDDGNATLSTPELPPEDRRPLPHLARPNSGTQCWSSGHVLRSVWTFTFAPHHITHFLPYTHHLAVANMVHNHMV